MSIDKRHAYESPGRLLRRPRSDPAMRRPPATVAGSGLVLLRVVAGVVWLAALVAELPQLVAASAPSLDDAARSSAVSAAVAVVLIVGGVGLALEVLLAALNYRGVNAARVVVMGFAVVSISVAFVAWWAEGQEITIGTTFVTLALDILVLLALSSRDAAAYARRNEPR